MGVHGLWKLIEPSGKPVPLETLENKVLAVDVSIWLHQAIKGFQDSKGAPLPNAHLLGIYHRVCKLLYFKIKPVFVFDGGVPVLKKETIAKRNQLKSKHTNDANKIQKQILNTLLKHTAVNKVLSEQTKSILPVKYKPGQELETDDLFKLPPSQLDSTLSSSEDEESSLSTSDSSPTKYWDIHTIDEKSAEFRSLPADVRHEILTDLKETRKQSSWGRIHELPTESNEFSGYQMKRLLKRWSIQSSLEETEKEMGGHSLSLGELESLLNDHGVVTKESVGNRIASDENTRFLYIKDVKKALEKARVEKLKEDAILQAIPEAEEGVTKEDLEAIAKIEGVTKQDLDAIAKIEGVTKEDLDAIAKIEGVTKQDLDAIAKIMKEDEKTQNDDLQNDLEYQRDLNLAIQMSLQDGASTSKEINVVETKKQTSNIKKPVNNLQIFSAAKSYMMEYSGLTPAGINDIIMGNKAQEEVSDSEQDLSIVSKLFSTDINLDSPVSSKDLKQNIQDQLKTNIVEQVQNSKESKTIEKEVIELLSDSDSNKCQAERENQCKTIETISNSEVLEKKKHGNEILVADNVPANNCQEVLVENNAEVTNLMSTIDDSKEDSESDNEDDFLEVPSGGSICDKKQNDSESDSDDFLEVPEETTPVTKSVLEVVIDVENKMEDDEDIFSDIFTDNKAEVLKEIDNKVEVPKETDNKVEVSKRTNFVNLSKLKEPSNEEVKDFGVKTAVVVEKEEMEKPAEDVVKDDEEGVVAKKAKVTPCLTEGELRQMERYLENEKESLIVERSNKERLANNITDQMYQEAQELLQLFGVPYIVAPMEAEAQCAFLNEANLTDGTITDDSDIWLFGGKTVYKNFFNQSKHVMEFRAEDIEHHFNLTRLKLIQLSLLVGSDYTVGLQGIGPVTALEILAAFPSYNENATLSYQQVISGLVRFRTWFKKGRIAGPGKTALRTKLRNIEVTENFPSVNVARAYLEPEVESSKEQFSWSKPDIIALTDFAKQKFGWTQKKSEEILNPVIKRLQESKAQTSIKDYFKTKHKINVVDLTDKMSKRVKTAVSRMGQDPNEEVQEKEKKPRARKTTTSTRKPRKSKKVIENTLEVDEDLIELQRVEMASTSKAKEMEENIKKELERNLKRTLHAKDVIHQKERDRSELVKNKLKAIESFRKSKHGPGFVKKRAKVVRKPKDDAELSESSSDGN